MARSEALSRRAHGEAVTSWYVVSVGSQRVSAASPRAAAEIVAAQPRIGEGKDFVVKSEREARALLSMIALHVGVSASGAVSVKASVRP